MKTRPASNSFQSTWVDPQQMIGLGESTTSCWIHMRVQYDLDRSRRHSTEEKDALGM